MFKPLKVATAIACLLYACLSARTTGAQTVGESGSLSSPTNNIYFSSPIAVTTTNATVGISGTPFAVIGSVFYAFWISLNTAYYPWQSSTNLLASNYANVIGVGLDQYGGWTQPGDLSGWASPPFGNTTAICVELILLGAKFTPPATWAGTSGGTLFSSVNFDYY